MKISRLILCSLAAGALLPVTGLLAQTTATPSATPSVSAPASTSKADADDEEEGGKEMKPGLAALTPEERSKLRAAHNAALKDPAVIAAKPNRKTDRKGYQKTVRDAMVKADPSVEGILEKMKAARRAHRKGE